MESTLTTTSQGKKARVWDFSDSPQDGWWDVSKAFVETRWPDAKNEGVGYWRIPRVANIFYGVGKVKYVPMRGQEMPKA